MRNLFYLMLAHVAAGTPQHGDLSQPIEAAPEHIICQVHATSEPEKLSGQTGQRVLGLHDTMRVQGFRVRLGDDVIKDFGLAVDLTAAYFVGRHVSLGGQIGYSHARTALTNPASNAFRVGPQVGYHIQLSPHVSLYPGLSVLYGFQSARIAGQSATHRINSVDVGFDLAFVLPLREHLSLSAGPFIKHSLYAHQPASLFRDGSAIAEASVVQTLYGVQIGLLGWL